MERDQSRPVEVLEVMNGIGDVICPVHDRGFYALVFITGRIECSCKLEFFLFSLVGTPLAIFLARCPSSPWILEQSIQACASEIETGSLAGSICQVCNNPEGLGITLKAVSEISNW